MSKFRQQHMTIKWHEISQDDSDNPAVSSLLSEKASLVGRVGLMFLASGAGAYRVRAAMNKLSRALNITCNANIGIKSLEYTCFDGKESYTNALSNVTTGVNTGKLQYLEVFCDGFTERADRYSIDDFHRMLDTINASGSNYNKLQLGLAAGSACAAFAFLLGADWLEMIFAFFAAAAGFFIRKTLLERKITLFANVFAAVLTSCLVYLFLVMFMGRFMMTDEDFGAGYICSILFLIPGFPLITGGIDLAKLDLRSGIERIVYAFLVTVVAAVTCAFTVLLLEYAPQEFDTVTLSYPVKLMLRFVMSFIGVYGFSMLFNSPARMAMTAGLIGAVANSVKLLITDAGFSANMAAFVGAFLAGLLATAIKGFVGIYPRITLTVPSIVIMVPGMFLYKGIHFVTSGNYTSGFEWLCKALVIIMALPLGLVFSRILTDKNFRISS